MAAKPASDESVKYWSTIPAGWSYRMFYLVSDLLEPVIAELFGLARRPFFSAGVIREPELAVQIAARHRLLDHKESMKLKRQVTVA